eukprot:3252117-Rhodomonas_salina.1
MSVPERAPSRRTYVRDNLYQTHRRVVLNWYGGTSTTRTSAGIARHFVREGRMMESSVCKRAGWGGCNARWG